MSKTFSLFSGLFLSATALCAMAQTTETLSKPATKILKDGSLVSSIQLEPLFSVPAKYKEYNRIELTELSDSELQKLPAESFQSYKSMFLRQASAVENAN